MIHSILHQDLKIRGNILAAPMAGYTNLPTRLLLQKYGADLTFTEMVSADGIVYRDEKTLKLLDTCPRETGKAVQIFGDQDGILKDAVEYIRDYTDFRIISINLGCPVKKILKSGKGGYLLKDENKLEKIFRCLGKIKGICLTIKIRSGWDKHHLNYQRVGCLAEENNVKLVVFHSRTVVQGFRDRADWDQIRELKQKLNIPVIGNGDITTPEEAVKRLEETGVDGIMIGRGFIGSPWIFDDIKEYVRTHSYKKHNTEERIRAMLVHLKKMIDYMGEKKGIINFRKQMLHYVREFPHSAPLRKSLQGLEEYQNIEKVCREWLR
ncbi:MAG: tRNA dihydrouridine synthase DusB [bacterium]|nr:tRNA dihydrouridine synthase DusB [bacterium]